MSIQTLDDLSPAGKTVLVRVDLNLPMQNGTVSDDTRLEAIKPTVLELSDKGAKVVLLAHFGRPKGKPNPDLSLRQILPALTENLGRDVAFAEDDGSDAASAKVAAMQNGDILLLENVRMHPGEEKNTPDFSKHLADLGDVYVNDAFSVSHRAHASTEGIAHFLPSYAGRSMQKEVEALEKALAKPQKPVAAIVGGAKVSTKLDLLSNLMEKVDMLLIGGGMANTFLAAQGHDVGKSLCEHDLLDTARAILAKAQSAGCEIILPVDGLATTEFKAHADNRAADVTNIKGDEMLLDAGPKSIELALEKLAAAKTVVWNGPFGAFEMQPFDTATNAVAQFVAKRTKTGNCLSVAGGGDTVAALKNAGVAGDFSYVSTAGGAFLEWLEGKTLPGIAALTKKA